jgi:hypothetical protein
MNDFDDLDVKKIKFNSQNLKDGGVSLFTRFLLRFWPSKGVQRLAKELGMGAELMNRANSLFIDTDRVDIIPSKSGERGFQIILNKSTALYFYQDGDHFTFDGAEVGEYEGGDVAIFDHLK